MRKRLKIASSAFSGTPERCSGWLGMKNAMNRCPFRPPCHRESAILPPDHAPTTTMRLWSGWERGQEVGGLWAAKVWGENDRGYV